MKRYLKAKAFTELLPQRRRFVFIDVAIIITLYLLQPSGEELSVLLSPGVSESVPRSQQKPACTERLSDCLPSTKALPSLLGKASGDLL